MPSSLLLLLLSYVVPSSILALPHPSGAPYIQSYTPIFSPTTSNKLSSDLDAFSDVNANANRNKFVWKNTSNVFAFGDSYTQTGWDVTKGVNSSDPGATSCNGPNWLQTLIANYSPNTSISTYNFAHGGATIDHDLVNSSPGIRTVSDQVAQFNQYLASSPEGAEWTPSNSLFVCFIGINDVIGSFLWQNQTHEAFYAQENTKLLSLLSSLKSTTSNDPLNFLLLSVPPVARAPVILSQGAPNTEKATDAVNVFNEKLVSIVAAGLRARGSFVGVFDTGAVFETLIENAPVLGYHNVTGFNELYKDGTDSPTTQISPFPPFSSYFWQNNLHPTWPVHTALAHAIGSFLGDY